MRHYRYNQKIHSDEKNSTKRHGQFKCSLCGFICVSRQTLYTHFDKKHDLKVSSKKLHFQSTQEFEKWKTCLEQQTHTLYVKQKGSCKTLNGIVSQYICQRSGYYFTRGANKRHLKIQGSKKINGFCPSEIRTIVSGNGEHEVSFIETHVGHDNSLGHLNLTASLRMTIAEKIAESVPYLR
nr:unnamed protein product [Callosobruchus analis]